MEEMTDTNPSTEPTYKYNTYLRSGNYPEIKALIKYLKRGKESGIYTQETTNTKQRARTDRILHAMVQCGWKEEVVTTLLTNMTDQMIPFKRDQDFVEAFMKELAARDRQMDEVCDRLCRTGLREEAVKEIRRVMTPLEDSCYTTPQMVDVSIEYLVGRNKPMFPSPNDPWTFHDYEDEISSEEEEGLSEESLSEEEETS